MNSNLYTNRTGSHIVLLRLIYQLLFDEHIVYIINGQNDDHSQRPNVPNIFITALFLACP